jgi:hypothetical protein
MDINQYDFHLKRNSNCLNSGTALTYILSSSGNQIQVENSKYFFDGFGKISGDYIQIGNKVFKILQIDYLQDILTLSSSINCPPNTPVNFPHWGIAPDLGTYQFNQFFTSLRFIQ